MRRAFTLVEMLIVVVVLVTLMTITFRLSSITANSTLRSRTIANMQRIENCLSGYYAAFGTYPPVRLHGSRNIYLKADSHGIQDIDSAENRNLWGWTEIGETAEYSAWLQVRAACKAQPVDCRFPFPDEMAKSVQAISQQLKRKAESNDPRYKSYWNNPERKSVLSSGFDNLVSGGNLGGLADEEDWRDTQLFRFGLMSFLLPRYMFMMDVSDNAATKVLKMKQWVNNNTLPHDPYTGAQITDWQTIRRWSMSDNQTDRAKVSAIPSQAICARWMPNLEGICSVNYKTTFFGIVIGSDGEDSSLRSNNPDIEVFNAGGSNSGNGQQYVLDGITVLDGWDQEFYYYCPAPYQTYTLWSGGPNKRTFPPWISRDELDDKSSANRCISTWIEDDIIHMSN